MNILERVCPGEVGNERIRSSTRQNDGGNANDSNSSDVEDPNLGNTMEA